MSSSAQGLVWRRYPLCVGALEQPPPSLLTLVKSQTLAILKMRVDKQRVVVYNNSEWPVPEFSTTLHLLCLADRGHGICIVRY